MAHKAGSASCVMNSPPLLGGNEADVDENGGSWQTGVGVGRTSGSVVMNGRP